MAKISREGGPTDARLTRPEVRETGDGPVVVPAGPDHQEGEEAVATSLSPEDAAAIEAMADDQPTTGAPDAEDREPVERPGSKGVRDDWVRWAADSGYSGPVIDELTVDQIKGLPDGPPDYDENGMLVVPDGASDATGFAVQAYNEKAVDVFASEQEEPAAGDEEEEAGAEDGTADGAEQG